MWTAPTRERLLPPALALITFLVFVPSLWNGFVEWDDSTLLTSNPNFRGLGWTQLRWMATNVLLGHYVPLTWLTFGIDYALWGMNPAGYHLTNVLLHSVNAVLVFFGALYLLAKATTLAEPARRAGATVAALFFALHPLRAESVAWVTERRDVLSGFFFLLTILAYFGVCEARGRRRRWLLAGSLAAFLAALASKAIVMTVPAVLVLLDVYPLRRLPRDPRAWLGRTARAVWLEKVPYLLLGMGGALVAYYGQAKGAAVFSLAQYPWVGLAFHSLWFYIYKTVVPLDLSPLYELPYRATPFEPHFLVGAVGVFAVSMGVLALWRAWPAGLAAWAYYGILLAPVTGLAHAGPQLTADRYSYLACLGWAVLVGAGAGVAARAAARGSLSPSVARLLLGSAVVGFAVLAGLTWRQVQVWHDTERLWRHAVDVTPECATCRINLGAALLDRHLAAAALEQFQRAVMLRPDRILIHGNIGLALASLGRYSEAIEHYERVLARVPDAVAVRVNLSAALLRLGRLNEGVARLREAVRVQKSGQAVAYFRAIVDAKPDAVLGRLGLMEAYLAMGETALAREQYESVLRLYPDLARLVAGAFPGSP